MAKNKKESPAEVRKVSFNLTEAEYEAFARAAAFQPGAPTPGPFSKILAQKEIERFQKTNGKKVSA